MNQTMPPNSETETRAEPVPTPEPPERRTQPNETLFADTALDEIERRVGLGGATPTSAVRRALAVVAIGWLPIALLGAAQSLVLRNGDVIAIASDIAIHARYLIAAPLLVLAERACAPQLGVLTSRFVTDGLVDQRERGAFAEALRSTRQLVRSRAATTAIIILAYIAVAAAGLSLLAEPAGDWSRSELLLPLFSPAEWWVLLVSLPLLLILIFGWLWRIALWGRLLFKVSGLHLQLIAAHPDGRGGLGFLGESLRAFTSVALPLSAIIAGRSAELVLRGGSLPSEQVYFNAGVLIALAGLFVAPLLVFMPTLGRSWRRERQSYNRLAGKIGRRFQNRWFQRTADSEGDPLAQPDFSTMADMRQVVTDANSAGALPMRLKDVVPLAVSMLLPFVPVMLMTIPLAVILTKLRALLL